MDYKIKRKNIFDSINAQIIILQNIISKLLQKYKYTSADDLHISNEPNNLIAVNNLRTKFSSMNRVLNHIKINMKNINENND